MTAQDFYEYLAKIPEHERRCTQLHVISAYNLRGSELVVEPRIVKDKHAILLKG